MRAIFATLVISMLTGGCAIGVQHDYNLPDAQLNIDTKESVAVAVQDRRPYVVSGDKTQDFVGLSRGGFGNPFDVTTLSGKPLANDIASSIAAAFRARKIPVTQVTVAPVDDDAKVQAALGAAKTGRSVLVTLFEWKADTYMVTQLI